MCHFKGIQWPSSWRGILTGWLWKNNKSGMHLNSFQFGIKRRTINVIFIVSPGEFLEKNVKIENSNFSTSCRFLKNFHYVLILDKYLRFKIIAFLYRCIRFKNMHNYFMILKKFYWDIRVKNIFLWFDLYSLKKSHF